MRKTIFCTLLLLFALARVQGFAQKIVFDSTGVLLGTVPEGPPLTYDFQFRNAGEKPLVVRKAISSCKCTSTEAPSDTIVPGDTGFVRIVFTTAGYPGWQSKAITIETNDPAAKELGLRFTVFVVEAPPEEDVPAEPEKD